MVTVAGALAVRPSLTTRRKPSTAPAATTSGAVNVGRAAVGEASVTAGPLVCVHAYVSVSSLSGSTLPAPSSVTSARSSTVCGAPAFATGGRFVFATPTVVVTGALVALPSDTVSWK